MFCDNMVCDFGSMGWLSPLKCIYELQRHAIDAYDPWVDESINHFWQIKFVIYFSIKDAGSFYLVNVC